jgi:hypothetical protein
MMKSITVVNVSREYTSRKPSRIRLKTNVKDGGRILWKGEEHDVVYANMDRAHISTGGKNRLSIPRGSYDIICWKRVESK